GEAGVIKVRASLPAREAAVGVLRCAQVSGVATAKLPRQSGQPGAETGREVQEIIHSLHVMNWRLLGGIRDVHLFSCIASRAAPRKAGSHPFFTIPHSFLTVP